MKIEYPPGRIWDVFISDDNQTGIVISINRIEVHFDQEYVIEYRNKHGSITQGGLEKLAKIAINHDGRFWEEGE